MKRKKKKKKKEKELRPDVTEREVAVLEFISIQIEVMSERRIQKASKARITKWTRKTRRTTFIMPGAIF